MIPNLFIILGTVWLFLINSLLNVIPFFLPVAAVTAIENAIAGLAYFYGVFPVAEVVGAISFFIGFLIIWYFWRVVLFILGLIPFLNIGTKHHNEKIN